MAYNVTYHSPEEIEEEWRSLLLKSAKPTIFQSPTWLKVWWTEFRDDRELFVAAVRKESELVGLAPLIQDNGYLSLAGDTEICDYMDITVARGEEQAVTAAVLDALSKRDWREWRLWGLRDDSPTLAILPDIAGSYACEAICEVEDVSPRVALPATWDEYLGSLNKKDRHELRRKLRRLLGTEAEVDLVEYREPAEIDIRMDNFLRLHVDSREEKAEFMTDQMARFFKSMAHVLSRENVLRLFELQVAGKAAAAVLCFDSADELLLYNSGYDPSLSHLSVGLLSKALSLQKAIEEGKSYYNFLRGAESYKYDLGAQDLPVYRCTVRRR